MTPPHRGCLLVAAPTLSDPNFFRSVVLLLAYDEEGALGVVLNRPSETPIAEIVPSWALHASPPGVLFSGGPVQPNAAICVGHHVSVADDATGGDEHRSGPGYASESMADGFAGLTGELDASALEDRLSGYSPLTGSIGTVDLNREPEDVAVRFAGLRVFQGYAGWGAGQLDDELDDRAWYVVEGSPDHILTAEPEGLWERVLRSQGGWMSVLARHPVDPSLN